MEQHDREDKNHNADQVAGAVAAGAFWPTPLRAAGQLVLFIVLYNLFVLPYLLMLFAWFAFTRPELDREAMTTLLQHHAESPLGLVIALLCQFLLIMPFVLRAAGYPGQQWKQVLAIRWVPAKTLAVWLGVLVVYLILQAAFNFLMQVQAGEFIERYLGVRHFALVLSMAAVAPVLEEAIFRGYLFSAWRHSRLGLSGTLVLTSAIFALMHSAQYSPLLLAQLFLQGLLFGLARERTGSVLAPLAMHASNNLVAGVLIVYAGSA